MGLDALPSLRGCVNFGTNEVSYLVAVDDLLSLGYLKRRAVCAQSLELGLVCRPVMVGDFYRACIDENTLGKLSWHVHTVLSAFIVALMEQHYAESLYGEVIVIVDRRFRVFTHRKTAGDTSPTTSVTAMPIHEHLTRKSK